MHKEPTFPVEGLLGRRARGDRFSKVSMYILGGFISLRKGIVNSFKENVLLIRPFLLGSWSGVVNLTETWELNSGLNVPFLSDEVTEVLSLGSKGVNIISGSVVIDN
jgi:hypothetical protein